MGSIVDFIIASLIRPFGRITKNFVAVPQWNTEELGAGLAWTDDPANQRGILSVDPTSLPPLTNVTATSVAVGPGAWIAGPPIASGLTLGAVNLLTSALPCAASGTLRVRTTIEAKILSYAHTFSAQWTFATKVERNGSGAPGFVMISKIVEETGDGANDNPLPFAGSGLVLTVTGAANNGSGLIRLTVNTTDGVQNGDSANVAAVGGVSAASGAQALTVVDGTHLDLRGSTFAGSYTSGGTVTVSGTVAPTVVGNTLQLQANGIAVPLWITGETVTAGAVRYAAPNTYLYTSNGTTSASPTGTTSGSDSGLTYDFHAASRVCNVTYQATDVRYWVT